MYDVILDAYIFLSFLNFFWFMTPYPQKLKNRRNFSQKAFGDTGPLDLFFQILVTLKMFEIVISIRKTLHRRPNIAKFAWITEQNLSNFMFYKLK
jgi:hypothetical protein